MANIDEYDEPYNERLYDFIYEMEQKKLVDLFIEKVEQSVLDDLMDELINEELD